uniref:dUTP diphosphatase n=1 Tax=Marseillevirus LCMAC103 TaxID=2506604 RepID=A0A481YV87_9VIRU|nr:MAG: dUTP diphosphatase [Marseillevirus LCMAC103]
MIHETNQTIKTAQNTTANIAVRLDSAGVEFPKKAHASAGGDAKSRYDDVGWDLYLISRETNIDGDQVGDVTMFDTGVAMTPAAGIFLMLVARSSLFKAGYQLVNGVGIIDPGYTGTIKVALLKFKEGADIGLPFKAVQAVPMQITNVNLVRARRRPRTDRGDGGFGSSHSDLRHSPFAAPQNHLY